MNPNNPPIKRSNSSVDADQNMYEENIKLRQQLEALNQQLQDCQQNLANCQAQIEQLNAEIAGFNQQIEQLNAEIADLQNQIQPLNAEITGLRQKIQDSDTDNAQLFAQITDLQNQIEPLNQQIRMLTSERDELQIYLERCKEDLKQQYNQQQQHHKEWDTLSFNGQQSINGNNFSPSPLGFGSSTQQSPLIMLGVQDLDLARRLEEQRDGAAENWDTPFAEGISQGLSQGLSQGFSQEQFSQPFSEVKTHLTYGIQKSRMQKDLTKQIQEQLNRSNPQCPNISTFLNAYQNQKTDALPIADPKSCFTSYKIESNQLLDLFRANGMLYRWREQDPSFGVSGELSIAGLTILAMETTKIIADEINTPNFRSHYLKNPPNVLSKNEIQFYKQISDFCKDYQRLFDSAFGKSQNRDSLDSPTATLLTARILIIIDSITKLAASRSPEDLSRPDPEYSFLKESSILLSKILLTKSSLDVSQASMLSSFVGTNLFCCFNSFDYSAVVNTEYAPVMGAIKYGGSSSEQTFIYDDNVLMSIFFLISSQSIKFIKDSLSKFLTINPPRSSGISSAMETDIATQIDTVERAIEDAVSQLRVIHREHLIEGSDISNTTELSEYFIQLMEIPIGSSHLYDFLQFFIRTNDIPAFAIDKDKYEKMSRLILNYNVFKGRLSYQALTKNSRDIQAHDYKHSPIRCFGIAKQIKRQLYDFFIINLQRNPPIPRPEDPEFDTYCKKNFLSQDQFTYFWQIYYQEQESAEFVQESLNFNSGKLEAGKTSLQEFCQGVDYQPMIEYQPAIQNLYTVLATRNAAKFEIEQVELLSRTRTCVMQLASGEDEPTRVLLNKGPVYQSSLNVAQESELNTSRLDVFKSRGFVTVPYHFRPEVIGCLDLNQKRGGVNKTIFGILGQNSVSAGDAASASIGDTTTLVISSEPATIYYNDFELCTINSGWCPGEKQEDSELIDSSFVDFKALMLASQYHLNASNAEKKFKTLYAFLANPRIQIKLLECLHTDEIGEIKQALDQIEDQFFMLVDELTGIQIKFSISELKKNTKIKYFDFYSPKIKKFLLNVTTLYDQLYTMLGDKKEIRRRIHSCLQNIITILYKHLCFGNYPLAGIARQTYHVDDQSELRKMNMEDSAPAAVQTSSTLGLLFNEDIGTSSTNASRRKGQTKGSLGGGEGIIGNYITLEDEKYILKDITNAVALERIKKLYNYYKQPSKIIPYGLLGIKKPILPSQPTVSKWGKTEKTLADLPKAESPKGTVYAMSSSSSSSSIKSKGGKSKANKKNKRFTKRLLKSRIKIVRKTKKRLNKGKRYSKRRKH